MAQGFPIFRRWLLVALLAAAPIAALAQNSSSASGLIRVSQDAPALAADDPLALWFKQQDSLLDDILIRLSHVEALVSEIQRLIAQLPDAASPQAATPPTTAVAPQTPAAVATSVAVPAPIPQSTSSFFWLPYALLLLTLGLLLADLLRRRHKSVQLEEGEPLASPIRIEPVKPTKPAAAITANTSITSPTGHQTTPYVESEQAEQAYELAVIMLSMGLGHGAAQTLTEQIKREPKQALRHWLKLLAIYRENGQREEFEQSAEELRKHFNVRPEDWIAVPTHAGVEDYPHITSHLVDVWRKPGCLAYIQELLSDNREGSRNGFPQAVAEELLLLVAMLKLG